MRKSNYDKRPVLHVRTKGVSAWQGWEAIGAQLRKAIAGKPDAVVCVDCYHGVWEADVLSALTEQLNPSRVFCTAQATLPKEQVNAMLKDHLTDDRVFGIMAHYRIEQFFDMERVAALRQEIALAHGVRLVFGVGAALLCEHPDVLVYADMARWEIQLRFRSGKLANWLNDNYDEDPLRKYKRGYFIEWRVLDRHKRTLHSHIDYLLDTNDAETPRMMTGDCYRDALKQAVTQPFRVAPYFDPGVWGGQWMKSVCGLDPEKPNYAWSFDGVPEENSLLLDVDGIVVETPAINLVHEEAKALLGDKVHARFGTEFPIRFDFLDTIGGGNLSLQVHPLTEYIQDTFGMHYTQDESYYILDAVENADTHVYLGCKTGIQPENSRKHWKTVSRPGSSTRNASSTLSRRKTRPLPDSRRNNTLLRQGLHGTGNQRDALHLHLQALGLGAPWAGWTPAPDSPCAWHEEHSVRPRYRLGAEKSCQPRGGDSRGRGHPRGTHRAARAGVH